MVEGSHNVGSRGCACAYMVRSELRIGLRSEEVWKKMKECIVLFVRNIANIIASKHDAARVVSGSCVRTRGCSLGSNLFGEKKKKGGIH